MAHVLSQEEIQEITRLLEQGKALPEKYRDVLFIDRKYRSEERTAAGPGQPEIPDAPAALPILQFTETDSTAFSLAALTKFLLEDPQIQQTISKYVGMVVSRGELPSLAVKCTAEMIETVPQALEHCRDNNYVFRWQNTKLRDDIKRQLYREIHERLIRREFEVRRDDEAKVKERKVNAKADEDEAVEGLLAKYADLINTFFVIAERRVSVLDEYGDEQFRLLPRLVDDCVAKIAGREGSSEIYIRAELKRGRISLNKQHKELVRIRRILPTMFAQYHSEQKGRRKTTEQLALLSGIDFETAVGRVLLDHGWHVTATPATGDQGADIIAVKEERRVIIQAKRYSGPVGNRAVQEVVGAILFYGGTEGCVVTNSTFTPAARALAQKNNIRLIDGSQFGDIGAL